jgi:hypothetical protein
MSMIDLRDLPEPLAKAIESMVQAYRDEVARTSRAPLDASAVADFDHALDDLFAADSRNLSASSLTYGREDIYIDHD